MKTLRDYENLIKETVKKISDNDTNWDWKVKEITDNKASIYWGYLGYCNGANDCFFLKLDSSDEDQFITIRTPEDKMIDGEIVAEFTPETWKSWQVSYESGIKTMLENLADYAHSRY